MTHTLLLIGGGAVATLIVLMIGQLSRITNDRGSWSTSLLAIALFYVVFAAEHGDQSVILFNILVALIFTAMALVGHRFHLGLIAAGFALHAGFDVLYMASPRNPAPDWWGPLCLGVDGVLAVALSIRLIRGVIAARSS